MTTKKTKTQVLLAVGAAPFAVAGIISKIEDSAEALRPQKPSMGLVFTATTTATTSYGAVVLFSVPVRELVPEPMKPEPPPDQRADATVQNA